MKKIIMLLMVGMMFIFTGCDSEEVKQMKEEDKQEVQEYESFLREMGAEEKEIREEIKELEKEQDETRELRIQLEKEKEEELARQKMEFEIQQEMEEEKRKAEEERLRKEQEAREEQERIEMEKVIAREDFIKETLKEQVGELKTEIQYDGYCVKVTITDNDETLKNSVIEDVEDVRYITIKENVALWSGELKDKFLREFKEQIKVKYYYNTTEDWVATAEDGFVLSDYLMY